jgi:iron complex transport system substrate-binding protein
MRFHTTVAAAFALGALFSAAAHAEPFTITDIAGREVSFDGPVERAILGEGRMIYFIAALEGDNAFDRIVGWRDDLRTTDLDGYNQYLAKFPGMKDIPIFGAMTDGTFQTELAVSLDPDVLLLPIEAETPARETALIETLEEIDVEVVFIDFRAAAFENTEKSMDILGKLFGKKERAAEFNAFRAEQIARVTDVIAAENPDRPLVFMDRAPGLFDGCCQTFGNENFGKMIELAGGRNLGSELLPGASGQVSAEQIIASDPDVYIATGANWSQYAQPKGVWVSIGAGADRAAAREQLSKLMERPAFTGVKAKETGNVHAIWHQFYTNPYQFVAIQQIAKWLHPELFADLDPDATFTELHERFLPVDYRPGYWASLGGEG